MQFVLDPEVEMVEWDLEAVEVDRNLCVRTIHNGRSNPVSVKMSLPLFELNSVLPAGADVVAAVG